MRDLNHDPRPKVLIASPHTGECHWIFKESLLGIYRKTDPEKVQIFDRGCCGSNIAENQNALVDQAEENGMDYILFLETDMGVPGEALQLLLSHGKDIVGCTYPFKDHDLLARNLADEKANLRYMGQELDCSAFTFRSLVEGEPLRRVKFVPMGLTLISMRAIRAVQAYRTSITNPPLPEGMKACAFRHAEAVLPNYKRTAITTTDSVFCYDAADAGIEVWLDARLSLLVEHVGMANYAMLPHTWAPPEMLEQSQ